MQQMKSCHIIKKKKKSNLAMCKGSVYIYILKFFGQVGGNLIKPATGLAAWPPKNSKTDDCRVSRVGQLYLVHQILETQLLLPSPWLLY